MLRVLIADDHDIVRKGLRQMLEEEFPQFEIEEAIDTTSLLELALPQTWDLIISDMVMPGGGGFHALKVIKEKRPAQPFILISNHSADQYITEAKKSGAEDFVNKNNLPGELIKAVQLVVDKTPI